MPYMLKTVKSDGETKLSRDDYQSVEIHQWPDEGKVEVRGHIPTVGDESHFLDDPESTIYVVNSNTNKTVQIVKGIPSNKEGK